MKVTDPGTLTRLIRERLPDDWGERVVRVDDQVVQVDLAWNDRFAGAEMWYGGDRPVVSGPVVMGLADTAMYGCCLATAGPQVTITTTFLAQPRRPDSPRPQPRHLRRPPLSPTTGCRRLAAAAQRCGLRIQRARRLGRRSGLAGRYRHHRGAPEASARPTSGVPKGMTGQLARFTVIGVVSTVVHLGLFVLFRGSMGALPANFVALLLTAVANTSANRRLTFGVRGRDGAARHQVQGLIVVGLGLALTSGALALLGTYDPHAGRLVELTALVVANGLATVVRFVLFRAWIFRVRTRAEPSVRSSSGAAA